MSTPDTTGLPDYAPVPRSALGPALNEQGYYVGRVERNLYWITDGTYQCAFLTTSDGVVLLDAPPTIGHNIQRAVDEIASANGVSNKVNYLIYSHHHADHVGASSLFDKNVTRIGHEETRRLLLRDDDPARRERVGGVKGRSGRDSADRSRASDREVHRRSRSGGRLHREHGVPGDAVHPARPWPRIVGAPLIASPPVRDPVGDHLLTPQNAALVVIDALRDAVNIITEWQQFDTYRTQYRRCLFPPEALGRARPRWLKSSLFEKAICDKRHIRIK
jgi:Metallo-beta-lactamase superfamily